MILESASTMAGKRFATDNFVDWKNYERLLGFEQDELPVFGAEASKVKILWKFSREPKIWRHFKLPLDDLHIAPTNRS
jgi:hypothetical protein